MVLDIEGFRKAGYAAVDNICQYYESIAERPVNAQVEPGFLAQSVPSLYGQEGAAPEVGEEWATISQDFQDVILPGITHWQSPNFFAYFPSNATFEGTLADLHVSAISNPGFNWACSPSVTELEILMMDWTAKMLGLSDVFHSDGPSGIGGGIILGSASEVALTVAIAARERALSVVAEKERTLAPSGSTPPQAEVEEANLDPDAAVPSVQSAAQREQETIAWRAKTTGQLVMYGTTQTHSIGAKAALILGLPFRALEVRKKDGYALRGETLRAALEQDERAGKIPFMLIATLGTTSSGAVDDITEIASIVRSHPTLWLHIDSAYAGVTLALPELRESSHLAAINEAAHSFSTNLHKWGLVQFDCSPLHVRDRGALSRALTITPEFLRTKHGDAGSVLDMRNMQISLGRRFRSLKIWFVLRSYGLEGFREHLRRSMDLSKIFLEAALQAPDLEIVAPPRWALVVFRLNPPGQNLSPEQLEELNMAFWKTIQTRSAEIALTQTVLPEVGFCIRFVTGSVTTREEHVKAAWKVVEQCARTTLDGFSTSDNPVAK